VIGRWIRTLAWKPYERAGRAFPLVPFRATVTMPVPSVTCIRIENAIVRAVVRFGGGYNYSVSYLVDGELLIDTGSRGRDALFTRPCFALARIGASGAW
jgi:hypothetical protein